MDRRSKNVQLLDYPGSLWIVRSVPRLSGHSMDCSDSFQIIWTVSGLSGQFANHPDSFLVNQTVLSKYMVSRKNFPDLCKNFLTLVCRSFFLMLLLFMGTVPVLEGACITLTNVINEIQLNGSQTDTRSGGKGMTLKMLIINLI